MGKIVETKWLYESRGKLKRYPVILEYEDNNRIKVVDSPFHFKDDIKAMQGSRCEFIDGKFSHWHFADSDRNRFQMEWLEGGNPYAPYEQEIIQYNYPSFGAPGFHYDLMSHQVEMANELLTFHFQVWGAGMGVGKTGAAIAAMVMSGKKGFWWVGPKSSLYGIRHEFYMWGVPDDLVSEMFSYEGMVKKMRTWKAGDPAPVGVIFDECHNLKSPSTQRATAAQALTNAIRKEYDWGGYALGMSGTPSPKNPSDWWSICEIICPGFVKEGDANKLEKRLGFYRSGFNQLSGQHYPIRVAWRNDEDLCKHCGKYLEEGNHFNGNCAPFAGDDPDIETHGFEKSVNEVALMYQRLQGLVKIVHKKDCLDLPEKIYKRIYLEPSKPLLRVASVISKAAPSAIVALTNIRELSDGFQYREVDDGFEECPICQDGTVEEHFSPTDPDATIQMTELLSPEFVAKLETRIVKCHKCNGLQKVKKTKRIVKEVPCPKDEAVVDLLEREFDQRRIVFFAGFTGSLDRLTSICQREGWDTMRVDGRGWLVEQLQGRPKKDSKPETKVIKLDNPMEYWIENPDRRIAFIAHPKSGGVSLTLCEQQGRPGAKIACFYSNDFNPSSRAQAEDRIHRTGMTNEAMIVDLLHLPTDERVLTVLNENRKLELMTMGELGDDYEGVTEE